MAADLVQLTPPKELTERERDTVFQHFFRRLAAHRNTIELYAAAEFNLSTLQEVIKSRQRDEFNREINSWAQALLENAWIVCGAPGGGEFSSISILNSQCD
jgi:hypothetical protein